ncbi:MAG: FGGY-family carbohydrate kinase [Rubrivivax sp.]|uniref:FGGY-family carbohydrate kinase n=1 Tax=Ottowia sp. TaxID=1898956 RepID=UPI00217AC964|nr:FGGY-family carbohydrate kinase [Ottowia sp.]MCC6814205.1 FGGY-family carbohydrate kinase [Rubrivivax sp.]MCZ2087867.1 FGGY-family carbohydrate kinase [Burkholderiales bacterium]HNI83869.1 FGGY-family carbohydrate kinase [Ottowia sp.]HNK51985.1 FGGY-family carbohydrate kinase [Ottowia sp.]HNN32636.1 FGGY-family carbohydrate kinase [Ottowia sp.]
MTAPCLLAIDCGTQSVRALLFDLQGQLLARAQVAIDSYRAPEPGWMEGAPEAFWQHLCAACHRLWATGTVPREAIAGVVLTAQRAVPVTLDADGQPTRPSMIWLDQRRAARAPRLPWWWEAALTAVGMRAAVRHFQHEAEACWIAQHQPELWARTRHFLLLSGYLNWRLCGRLADSVAAQVGYVPFDYRRGRWAAPWDWKWHALPVRRAMLPELLPPGARLGTVSAEAAQASGIPAGLPLIAGAADKACEVLGAGCLSPEVACLSYGTAATVNITTARYLEATRFIPPYPAAVPGHFNPEVQITRGFWMVRWFREQFGQHEERLARERGVAPETLFDELVGTVPPGAQGLTLQPFWNPGIKQPGPEAKGAIIGFGDVHTRAHLYRAILEGLAYALREAAERVERRSGIAIERVRVAGGGSQSDAALQITANVFNRPAERPHLYETSGLGAAIIASVGLGLQPDFASAVRAMTRVGQVFAPQPEHAHTYERLYRRVYLRMYRQLAPLYRDIRDITGYPSRD